MNFGKAIEALKQGKKVAREGWNGKGMFLWLKPETVVKETWCKDPVLLGVVKKHGLSTSVSNDSDERCKAIVALGTICMKTSDDKILTGWLASQTDMLSEDWKIVEG